MLVGLPGSGKTAVGRALAGRWGCDFLDTDDLVGSGAGGAGALLREVGEPAFRERELVALRQALDHDAVVATGGGVVTIPAAREALRSQPVAWLDASDATILARLDDGDRPLLGESPAGALAALRRGREDLYRDVARWRIDAAGDPDEVANRIEAVWA